MPLHHSPSKTFDAHQGLPINLYTYNLVACVQCNVTDKKRKIVCLDCDEAQHIECSGLTPLDLKLVDSGSWNCTKCFEESMKSPDKQTKFRSPVNTRSKGTPPISTVSDIPRRTKIKKGAHGQAANHENPLPPTQAVDNKNPPPSTGAIHKNSTQQKSNPDESIILLDDQNQNADNFLESTHHPDNRDTKSQCSKAKSRRSHSSTDLDLAEAELDLSLRKIELQKEELLLRHQKKIHELEKKSQASQCRQPSLTHSEKNREVQKWASSQNQRVKFNTKQLQDPLLSKSAKDNPVDEDKAAALPQKTDGPVTQQLSLSRAAIDPSLVWMNPRSTTQEFLQSTTVNSSNARRHELSTSQLQARWVIPKELPQFSGEARHWPQFISTYINSTMQCGFTDEENVARLAKSLKGEAYERVRGHLSSASGLSTALKKLKQFYGRPGLVFDAAIQHVLASPPLHLDKLETWVEFSSRLEQLCVTVKNAEMTDYLNNPQLLSQLIDRLPTLLRVEWSKRRREIEIDDPLISIDTFNTWMEQIADDAISVTSKPISFSSNKNQDRKQTRKPDPTHSLVIEEVDSDHTEAERCRICKVNGHSTEKCEKFNSFSVNKRWEEVRKRKLCVSCLGQHWVRYCKNRKECQIDGCVRPHHKLLHKASENSIKNQQKPSSLDTNTTDDKTIDAKVNLHQNYNGIYYQILPVQLTGDNGKSLLTFAFLDTGANVTLIDQVLADELGVDGDKEPLTLKWTNNQKRIENSSRSITINIRGIHESNTYRLAEVRTIKDLQLPYQHMAKREMQSYPHLKEVPVNYFPNVRPQILIGLDQHQLLTAQETIEGAWNEPVAIRTRLGWTIFGNSNVSSAAKMNFCETIENVTNNDLHDMVKHYFSFESLGVQIPKSEVESKDDARARAILKDTVQRMQDGRYEAGLLWSSDNINLPNSKGMAYQRLKSFERRLNHDQSLKNEVSRQMSDYVNKGYLVQLNDTEANETHERTWYLPIFAVTNINKPGKVRLVWDAAAVVDGQSLNSNLLTGPDLLESLIGVMFRFRERQYAVGGDLEQMFHQVKIRRQDQDSQLCLWRDNPREPVKIFRMTRMIFGASCSPCTAQFVKNYHAERYKDQFPRAVEAIQRNHYVDDFIDSFSSAEECLNVTKQVKDIHREAGFNLRNFVSNCEAITENLPLAEPTATVKLLHDNDTTVLGMRWHTKNDELHFNVDEARIGKKYMTGDIPTKRKVLCVIMMIYDPLGFLSFFIVRGKLLLKSIWRSGIDWDQQLKPSENEKWQEWMQDLPRITDIKIPRWYFSSMQDDETFELHIIVDASENVAAAIVYVVRCFDNYRESSFVASKTKVAPNRPISIPRMELQAAVLGVRLANMFNTTHTLKITRRVFWSDSINVLCWINSPRKFKVYVAHRIGEILESSIASEWRWIPTKLNVADFATKCARFRNSLTPPHWFQGPGFLCTPENNWPKSPSNLPAPDENDIELRCTVVISNNEFNDVLRPDISRFSNLSRLLRTQAYVLRFFNRHKNGGPLESQELIDAENYLVRSIQQEAFGADFEALKKGKAISKNSQIRQYSPFLSDEQIIRSRSRLINIDFLSLDQKLPIILPKSHRFTDLVISNMHRRFLHQNHSAVINELHQKYIISSLRAKLKSLRAKCISCRKERSKIDYPEMAPLPQSRFAINMRPFSHTGLDYFGPMLVTIGRRKEKRWGALFTCLTTRAIHLEIATSLSTESFILVFRMFISRRGHPNIVYCDRGTNFKGAESSLRQVLENIQKGLQCHFSHITWKFNPPLAPHMGGAWERLVRSVKEGLRAALPERNFNDETLRSLLCEVEAQVNARPLTYVETAEDAIESITPNHFLLGASSGVKPIGLFTDDPSILKSAWKRQQQVSEVFWRRWTSEYLPSISQRTKWFEPVDPLKEGDVVTIVNPEIPHSWQLGRVEKIITSADGQVRQVDVRTADGVYRRPAAKIAILLRDLPDDNTTHDEAEIPEVSSAGGNVGDTE